MPQISFRWAVNTSFIWRNCLVRELNIPDVWRNPDCEECKPSRQDLFWVSCSKKEVLEKVANRVRNIGHLNKIAKSVIESPSTEFHFLITRDLVYIQHYPYLNMNTGGSLWQKFGETTFCELCQLESIEVNQRP